MSSILSNPNDTIIVSVHLPDKAEDQYPQAKIYNSGNTLITTLNLTHQVDGYYMNTYSTSIEGLYSILYTVYSDSGYSVINTDYPVEENDIWTNDHLGGAISFPQKFNDNMQKVDWDKIGQKVWKTNIKDIKEKDSAGQILKSKSEFDPQEDYVQVDLKEVLQSINDNKTTIDFSGVVSGLNGLKEQLKIVLESYKQKDEFNKILESLKQLKEKDTIVDLSEVLIAIDNIHMPEDKSQELVSKISKEIQQIKFPVMPEKIKLVDEQLDNFIKQFRLISENIKTISFKKEADALNKIIVELRQELTNQKKLLTELDSRDNKRIGLLAGALDSKLNEIEGSLKRENVQGLKIVLEEIKDLMEK